MARRNHILDLFIKRIQQTKPESEERNRAFQEYVEMEGIWLKGTCINKMKGYFLSMDYTEDLSQEFLIKLERSIQQYTIGTYPKRWINSVMLSVSTDLIRREGKHRNDQRIDHDDEDLLRAAEMDLDEILDYEEKTGVDLDWIKYPYGK